MQEVKVRDRSAPFAMGIPFKVLDGFGPGILQAFLVVEAFL